MAFSILRRMLLAGMLSGVTMLSPSFAAAQHSKLRVEVDHQRIISTELPRRVPVFISLITDEHGSGGGALIARKGTAGDHILLTAETANRENLASALHSLRLLRQLDGDTVSMNGLLRVSSSTGARQLLNREGRKIDGVLTRIQTLPVDRSSRWGAARTTTIYLPSNEMRRKRGAQTTRAAETRIPPE